MIISVELNVPMDDINVYTVAQVDDFDGDLDVKCSHIYIYIVAHQVGGREKRTRGSGGIARGGEWGEIKLIF